ncbi:MAG TPA: bifunctional nuclease domain-containing protein [Streptosporangiaceae bacterium]|nr:bifunctional nuclease domain-containing protein [Streptosporangiaceae bacterium]
MQAALLGDKESLGRLVQRHWQTAVFLAARVLGSHELASDAVQEASIAAMTGLDRLRSPERFGAWFCGITLHVARRWAGQLRSDLPGAAADPACPLPGPAEAVERADIAARVRGAIALLADGQAQAVRLFYLQGLSHREVATELGISPGAVKARLHQARAALAPKLADISPAPTGTPPTGLATKTTNTNTNTAERNVMASAGTAQNPSWVDVEVTEIRRASSEGDERENHIMIISETGGDRRLPIWIGPSEATALAMTLESTETPRPLTYKLAASLVTAADAQISEVRITRLQPPVFYASVLINSAAGTREVDARPSDAVTLAITAGAPIRMDNTLFDTGRLPEHAERVAASPVVTADLVATHLRQIDEAFSECEEA